MFQPPRCPYRRCTQYARPEPRFYLRYGSYAVKCRAQRVPRFYCKSCQRTFSRQTFRMDYCDHRPNLNAHLFQSLASGVGLRQSARNLRLSWRCTELKARKIGRHLRRLNLNLRGPLPRSASFQFDELESYEGRRNTRPLSLPVLIERDSRFVVWAESATIRPRGKMTSERRAAIEAETELYGARKDLSRKSIRNAFRCGAELANELEEVRVETDEKSTYPKLLHEAFGARLVHTRTNSKLPRTTWNPLFPVNHTEAMARDLMGRLRRESWLVSKKKRWLDVALHVFIAYRNYVRARFNGERASPAQVLGYLPRRLKMGEILSWRQDGGGLSIHPLSKRSESVLGWAERRRASA